jgi:protein transport protein SEC23
MRSFTDLQKSLAPLFNDACKFYKAVAARASASGHAVDFFGCSLDQVGLLELKPCVTTTGGLVVIADSFGQSVFKESFRRVFKRWGEGAPEPDRGHLQMGFNAVLEVVTSREFKISGAIGPCVSLKKVTASVSDTEVGECGTSSWSLGAIDPSTTLAVYFDIANQSGAVAPNRRHQMQFITYYQHASGAYRMRVTTCAGVWNTDPNNLSSLAASFDQEAAAVAIARIAVGRTETEDTGDILRWLDRSLIRLCSKFAEYRKDDPSSFRLASNFSLFPQFMFHLRRSQFMQTFNSSPDEAAYARIVFTREDVTNALVMIQPSLISYSFSAPPAPVLLDAMSVRPDVVLLLDTFFHVLVFHGETIAHWREQKFHEQPEHAAFRELLAAPKADAGQLMEARFPVPRYIVCDQHKSQARFLMARLNPSVTHNTNGSDGGGAAPIFTDDVSFSVFMEHLIKLSTQGA